jgi:thiamine biosynthesis protein ThiS
MNNEDMDIRVNGEMQPLLSANFSIEDVLKQLGLSAETGGIAVALNYAVVPRSEWKTQLVKDGDELEVIGASQGG